MFERYTEQARRTIFFARYEASRLHTARIEPIHLLLGLLREDTLLRQLLASSLREQIEREIAQNSVGTENVSTSMDLPLTTESKRVLDVAAEEAGNQRGVHIDSSHLVLALLRLGSAPIDDLLRRGGVTYDHFREALVARAPRPPAKVVKGPHALEDIPEAAADQRLKRLPWTRKEALGHLLDWATAHHQWVARALVEKKVIAHGYPTTEAVAAQQYGDMLWLDLVIAWLAMNDLLTQVIARIPPDKLQTPCRIGIEPEVPLARVIERYSEYTTDILSQICARGDQ